MQKFAKVGYSTEFDKAIFFFAHVKALLKNEPINDVAFIFMAGICRSGSQGPLDCR